MRKVCFQIHWFLGIFFSLFLTVVALSGAVLSFEKEIKRYLNQELYPKADAQKVAFVPSNVIQTVAQKYPQMKLVTLVNDTEALLPIVTLLKPGQKGHEAMQYGVNPDTGAVTLLRGERMFIFLDDFHRRFLLGFVGKQMVALSTVSLLILLLLGVYLYWGSLKRRFFASFKIDFKKSGKAFVYQLHASIGMWLLPWYLLIALSGIYWSYEWYSSTLHSLVGVKAPLKHGGQGSHKPAMQKSSEPMPLERFDEAWNIFSAQVPSYRKAVLLTTVIGKNMSIRYLDENPSHEEAWNTMMIALPSMEISSHQRYDTLRLSEQLIKSMSVLHSGEFFGWIGRISVFIASLSMLLFVITGWILYLRRRRQKHKKEAIFASQT